MPNARVDGGSRAARPVPGELPSHRFPALQARREPRASRPPVARVRLAPEPRVNTTNRAGALSQFFGEIHFQDGGRRLAHSRGQVRSQSDVPVFPSRVGRIRAQGAQRLDTDDVLVTIFDASPETIVPATRWPLPEGNDSRWTMSNDYIRA